MQNTNHEVELVPPQECISDDDSKKEKRKWQPTLLLVVIIVIIVAVTNILVYGSRNEPQVQTLVQLPQTFIDKSFAFDFPAGFRVFHSESIPSLRWFQTPYSYINNKTLCFSKEVSPSSIWVSVAEQSLVKNGTERNNYPEIRVSRFRKSDYVADLHSLGKYHTVYHSPASNIAGCLGLLGDELVKYEQYLFNIKSGTFEKTSVTMQDGVAKGVVNRLKPDKTLALTRYNVSIGQHKVYIFDVSDSPDEDDYVYQVMFANYENLKDIDITNAVLSSVRQVNSGPTEGWQAYTNKRYGFEFKYPKEFSIYSEQEVQNKDGDVFVLTLYPGHDIRTSSRTLVVMNVSTTTNLEGVAPTHLFEPGFVNKTLINNVPLTFSLAATIKDSATKGYVMRNEKGALYVMRYDDPSSSKHTARPTLLSEDDELNMIRTFRFIKPEEQYFSGWGSYRNHVLGYEMDYPLTSQWGTVDSYHTGSEEPGTIFLSGPTEQSCDETGCDVKAGDSLVVMASCNDYKYHEVIEKTASSSMIDGNDEYVKIGKDEVVFTESKEKTYVSLDAFSSLSSLRSIAHACYAESCLVFQSSRSVLSETVRSMLNSFKIFKNAETHLFPCGRG
jgi:hypothetical protein